MLHSQVTCIMYRDCIIVYTHVYHAHVSGAHLRSRRDFQQSDLFTVNTKCANNNYVIERSTNNTALCRGVTNVVQTLNVTYMVALLIEL